ncbi:hypothetical protein [Paenibacillus sp. IHBB 3054]|uniref:hypothetical protein n=1 Tax=Paenibacillus sp. IHBB 3054 TaxID=3425689 RepID=UPI003F680D9B
MLRSDPVYQILKLLEEEKELYFKQIGIDERDFNIALKHIHEAGYANSNGITQSGLDYIKGYEDRVKYDQQ